MEIPRGARGADLIKNRYVAPQPLAPACSDGRSRIDLVEKAHLHVRFIASKSETQKRPQRASQTLNCGRLRTGDDDLSMMASQGAFEARIAAVSAFLACWRQTAHVDEPSRYDLSACA